MGDTEIQPVRTTPTSVAADTGVLRITGDSTSGWSATFTGGQPVIGFRITDGAERVIREGYVDADWVRVGGTERCGGPREAGITLSG